ncbi:hypothetical protein Cfla_3254 [Cellulomonas flavigena DSM 20109]|uniref:Uncharacterized protein n=2 Tax=Cellulomonas flavigena TaxID=1711 RepID=D5UBX6_CELFN|nr:hypothetical protein Cfla_3254 [Cellulomonas flavigena DSM 20109]
MPMTADRIARLVAARRGDDSTDEPTSVPARAVDPLCHDDRSSVLAQRHRSHPTLLAGPGGVLTLETAWQVTEDGYRLTTIIPMGRT